MINIVTKYAKAAYDGYCNARDWKSVRGEPLPQFEEQSRELQKAWQKAADAIISQLVADSDQK